MLSYIRIFLFIMSITMSFVFFSCGGTSGSGDHGSSGGDATINIPGSEQILHPSDRNEFYYFGNAVAISGDYALVGAKHEGSTSDSNIGTGAVYVFKKQSDHSWLQVQKLEASDSTEGDGFGTSVGIYESYAIIGAEHHDDGDTAVNIWDSGAAYIFELKEDTWEQTARLQASNKAQRDRFGNAVSISGNYAVVGASYQDSISGADLPGAVYVYKRDTAGNWTESQMIYASDKANYARFGKSVSIDKNIIVVGAHRGNNFKGAGYIYELKNETWEETAILKASDESSQDDFCFFGTSVSISGNYVIIGAEDAIITNSENEKNADGAAYIFEKNSSGAWVEVQKIQASDIVNDGAGYSFGNSVSIYGNYAVVGCPNKEIQDVNNPEYDWQKTTSSGGGAYLYQRNASGKWVETEIFKPSDFRINLCFGQSVAINSSNILIGANDENFACEPKPMSESAYIYKYANGTDDLSGTTGSLSAPSTPTIAPGDGKLTVSWTEVTGATSYEVYYSQTNASTGATKADGTITGLTYTIAGLTNDSTYYVWIKAVNSNGTSDYSNAASGIPSSTATGTTPSAPSKPVVISGNGKLTVNWPAVSGAASYEVYYSETNDNSGATQVGGTIFGNRYTITGLSDTTTYYIWIKAVNSNGPSDFSSGGCGTTNTPDYTAVNADWNLAATSYKDNTGSQYLYKCSANGSTGTNKIYGGGTDGTRPYTTDSSVCKAGVYTGVITVADGGDVLIEISGSYSNFTGGSRNGVTSENYDSSYTAFEVIKLDNTSVPPGIPSAPTATSGDGKLTVNWTEVTGATSYEVYYSLTNSSSDATKADGTITGLTYTITGLTNDSTYYVWIKAVNSNGRSDYSNAASGVPSSTAPSAPSAITVVSGDSQLTVSWTAVTGATSYRFSCWEDNNNRRITEGSSTLTSRPITGLVNGFQYYVKVQAVNAKGSSDYSISDFCIPQGSTPGMAPSKPSKPTVIPGNGQLKLNWTAVERATSYEVYYVEYGVGGSIKPVGGVITDTSYTITGLTNFTEYNVWIKAVNASGSSYFSNMATGMPSR